MTVLVVDDERTIADTLVTILRQQGYRAVSVYSGLEAVAAAKELRPEIIIMDVIMPRLGGIEAAKSIQRQLPDCRIVLLSAQPTAAEAVYTAREQGYRFEFIAKPAHPRMLLERLRRSA